MAIDKDKIPQPLSDAELESMIRGLREIGVSAKEIEKIMEGVNKENQKLIKNLEHVESVQKRITDLNIKDNDIVQQVNTVLEERIEKEGKISKFTEDRVKNLEFINNTDNEGLSIAEKRVKIRDRSKQVDIQINQARNERGQFNKGFNQDIEKGLIKGYDKKFDGPIENHPANVAARLEHQMMDIDGEKISPEAIAYNLLKVK